MWIWFERAMWIVLVVTCFVHNWSQHKAEMRLRKRLRAIREASRYILAAATRDLGEYQRSPLTKEHRENGIDISIMVVARASVWREFIDAWKGE